MDLSKNTLTTSHGATFCIYYDPQNTIPICRNGSLESFQRSVVWIETSLLRGFDGEIDPISVDSPMFHHDSGVLGVYVFHGGLVPARWRQGLFLWNGGVLGEEKI
jgi:hypothetical protein